MRANHAKRRLQDGEPSIGTWLSLPSPEAAEYIADLGFDWLTVDAEHNAIDITSMSRMFGMIAAAGTAPLVRIPWNTAENIKRVLDAGAWGIVVPMVNSRAEAEAAVSRRQVPAAWHPQPRRWHARDPLGAAPPTSIRGMPTTRSWSSSRSSTSTASTLPTRS